MLVAVAPLHFSCGFRRGFRRVPLGPGHANVRLGAKAPCQKWQVPWPAFGRPAGFSRDPREGPAAFWWGPGRFQVPPRLLISTVSHSGIQLFNVVDCGALRNEGWVGRGARASKRGRAKAGQGKRGWGLHGFAIGRLGSSLSSG